MTTIEDRKRLRQIESNTARLERISDEVRCVQDSVRALNVLVADLRAQLPDQLPAGRIPLRG